jgi:DNA-binding HxlR family transcriptional regulator
MATNRRYPDGCAIATALDYVGERWALLIVRELLLGPKRFTDLRAGLPHVGPDVLTQRLKDLDATGVIRRRTLPPPAAAKVYELTPLGRHLEPVIMALGDFGSHLPVPEGELCMSFDSHILSLRTLFRGPARDMRIQLILDAHPFAAVIERGAFHIERGELDDPDATIEGDPGVLIGVAHGRLAFEGSGLEIDGDAALARQFLTLFPLPDPVPA